MQEHRKPNTRRSRGGVRATGLVSRRALDVPEAVMNPGRVHRAIEALRIVLGVVVLIQSVQALLPRETGAHSALLAHLLPVLAEVEILGAVTWIYLRRLGLHGALAAVSEGLKLLASARGQAAK
jgi:hypothetical protein